VGLLVIFFVIFLLRGFVFGWMVRGVWAGCSGCCGRILIVKVGTIRTGGSGRVEWWWFGGVAVDIGCDMGLLVIF
jgi:hypothetical protein